jgi:predicted MPP superfamily phosphohydrolase
MDTTISVSQQHIGAGAPFGLPDIRQPLAHLSLPRIDFTQILQEQVRKANSLKKRVLRPPSLGERILNLIEGPWAPEALDLPIKRALCSKDPFNNSYRTAPCNLQDSKERRSLRDRVRGTEKRTPISSWTTIYSYDVSIRDLHHDLDGFTIVHLSDIHLLKGCDRPWRELHTIADALARRREKIGAILLSGDVITKGPQDLCSNSLRALERIANLCPWAFMVHGNHDYHGHLPALISSQLADVGFHDINNHHIALRVGNAPLNVYGVDDAYFGAPVLPHDAPKEETNVILTHNLDAVRRRCTPHIDLILSGHTHWGEVRFLDGSKLMGLWGYCDNINAHTKGWEMLTARSLSYVHPGLARYYVPFRTLRVPPGIAIHTLKSHKA